MGASCDVMETHDAIQRQLERTPATRVRRRASPAAPVPDRGMRSCSRLLFRPAGAAVCVYRHEASFLPHLLFPFSLTPPCRWAPQAATHWYGVVCLRAWKGWACFMFWAYRERSVQRSVD